MIFIHFGDVHLHNGPLLTEIIKCCFFIRDRIKEVAPDLVIIPGDLFDLLRDNDNLRIGSPATIFAMDFVKDLADIAPVLIVGGTLSHDATNSITVLSKLNSKYPVHTATTPQQIALTGDKFIPLAGNTVDMLTQWRPEEVTAVISCLPSITKAGISQFGVSTSDGNRTTEELVRDILQMWGITNEMVNDLGIPTILAGHLTVKGSVTSTGQKMIGRELEFGVADLKLAACGVNCLNHIHKAQQINSNIFYSGSVTRLDHGETEEKGFYIHEFPGDKTVVSTFVKAPARVMKTVTADGLPGVSLLDGVEQDDIIRIKYTVREDQISSIDEQALRQAALDKGAKEVQIDKEVIPIQRVRAEGISQLNSVEEKFLKWGEVTGQEITESLKAKQALLIGTDITEILKSYSDSDKTTEATLETIENAA